MEGDEGVIDDDEDSEDLGMEQMGRQWCYRRCPAYFCGRRRKVWKRRRTWRRRSTTTRAPTTTASATTTSSPPTTTMMMTTTLTPEVRTKGPRDPNCSDFNNFDEVIHLSMFHCHGVFLCPVKATGELCFSICRLLSNSCSFVIEFHSISVQKDT